MSNEINNTRQQNKKKLNTRSKWPVKGVKETFLKPTGTLCHFVTTHLEGALPLGSRESFLTGYIDRSRRVFPSVIDAVRCILRWTYESTRGLELFINGSSL